MTLDWFPWFPNDFRRDTYGLSLEEDGAYRRLIDEYMISRAPLPNDDAALARILGIPKADWDRLALRVRRFFRVRNDKLYHKRCESELRAQNTRHNRNSERGKKAAFAKYSKINGMPSTSMLTPATLQYKRKTTTSRVAAREPQQATAPAALPESGQPIKRPHETTREEIEAIFKKTRTTA